MCSLTMLFYNLSEKFGDDLRLISYFISEDNPKAVYKKLLKGNFDQYAIIFKDKLDNFKGDLDEWKADCMLKIDFSRDEMMLHDDFENLEI